LGPDTINAEWRIQDIRAAFEAENYEKVISLHEELPAFIDPLTPEGKAKLAGDLAEVDDLARKAKARLDFAKLPLDITGVVVSEPKSYVTINDVVLGEGDLVRQAPTSRSGLRALRKSDPLDPPVKVSEIHLNYIVFEFMGEHLSKNVGRRYMTQERASVGRRLTGRRTR
jgi:hypothetical protein